MNEQVQTAVTLSKVEFQSLIELFRLAQARLTTAEQLFFDQLFGRFDKELSAQEADQLNAMRRYEEALMQPNPATGNAH